MSEYLDLIDFGGKTIKLHHGEPAVYSTDAGAQSIREVYVNNLTVFDVIQSPYSIDSSNGTLTLEYYEIGSSGTYLRSVQARSISNGVCVFNVRSFNIYMYIDGNVGRKISFSINRGRCDSLTHNPVIANYIASVNIDSRIANIEKTVSTVNYTDNVEFNSFIKELYYTGIETKFRIDYRGNVAVKVLDDNNVNVIKGEGQQNSAYLSDGLNVFETLDANNKLYIICDLKSIKTTYEGNFTDSALDINCSPAIASYIATEKLIEEKLSSITNP